MQRDHLAALLALVLVLLAPLPVSAQERNRRLEWSERKELAAVVTRCLTCLTGTPEENAHVSVGRLANHFGFVHFRISSGHTVERAGLGGEVVDLLDAEQVEGLLRMNREQQALLAETRSARLALNARLERMLDEDEEAPLAEVVELGRAFGLLEVQLAARLAQGFSSLHASLSEEQRQALAELRARWESGGGRREAGRGRSGAAARSALRDAPQEEVQEFWNLATRLLTWTTGTPEQNDFDTAGKPSQHFGFVSLRVESGHAVTRGGIADAVEEVLSEAQLEQLRAVVTANAADFEAFFAARAAINRELERGLSGLEIRVDRLPAAAVSQAEAEARMTHRQALAFLEVRRELEPDQALALLDLRERYLELPSAEEAAADPLAAGRALFRTCALCHVPQQEGRAIGPSLTGIFGRPVASLGGHPYSAAMRELGSSGARWTRERLDRFLADPRGELPGTAMGFRGLPDPALRAALIDFLAGDGTRGTGERPLVDSAAPDPAPPTAPEPPPTRSRAPMRVAGQPNILLLLSDDQAWSGLGLRMDPEVPESAWEAVSTPALARLAEEGMRCSRGYSPAPVCSPTRASLQTGKSPARLGWSKAAPVVSGAAYALVPPPTERELSQDEITIAERLAALGYRTAHFGKWHLSGGGPAAHGYEVSDGDTSNRDADPFVDPNPVDIFGMVERTEQFVRESQQAGKPFFAQLSFHALHRPDNASAHNRAAVEARMPRANDKAIGRAALTQDLDEGIGRLLELLDREGLASSTFVIFMSDNGAKDETRALSGAKGGLYESGIRVPMIVRGPEVPAGSVTRVPVVGFDLYPTFLEWAGDKRPLPAGIEGGSLAALLAGEADEVQRPQPFLAFHFPHYQGQGRPQSALVRGRWKLLHDYETNGVELYDLQQDRAEQRDLAPERAELAAELDALLVEHLESCGARLPTANPDHDADAKPAGDEKSKGGNKRGKRSKGDEKPPKGRRGRSSEDD